MYVYRVCVFVFVFVFVHIFVRDTAEMACAVEITQLPFHTNYGDIRFEVWEIPGQSFHRAKWKQLRQGYYLDTDAALIMFDVTKKSTYKAVASWHGEIVAAVAAPDMMPMVLMGNKVDVKHRVVRPRHIGYHRNQQCMQYYDISARSNYNFEKPFLWLARKLSGCADLRFVPTCTIGPPPVTQLDANLLAQFQRQLEEARDVPLPDDDEL